MVSHTAPKGQKDTGAGLAKLIRVLDEFRKINQNITANQMLVFLHVATKPDVTQKDLERLTGLNNGTISRICAIMSDRGLSARNAEAMGLIKIGFAPGDYRARSQSLTPQGRRVEESVRHIMEK